MQRQIGFTLIELMITVAVIGILTMVALPSYKQYVTKSRRTDAQTVLLSNAQELERYYTVNSTYLNDTECPTLKFTESPVDGSNKYYDITASNCTSSGYLLTATPKNSQMEDGAITLVSTGVKGWDKDNNGTVATDEHTWR